MPSKTYNKAVINGVTYIDLSSDTVTADKLLSGYTAHDKNGVVITGIISDDDGYVWQDGNGYVHLSDEQGTLPITDSLTVSASGTYNAPTGHVYNPVIVPSGSATPASTISATGATVSTGTNTVSLSKSVSNTPTVSSGFITSGTSGNSSVSLTASVNTRSSADLTASTLTVTAPSGYYASNATKTLTDANLTAGNIKKDVPIFGVTGTYEGGGGGGSSYSAVSVGSLEVNVSTTSTSTVTISDTLTCSTANFSPSKFIYIKVRDKAGKRNGYFYGADLFFFWRDSDGTTYFNPAKHIYRCNSSGNILSYAAGTSTFYGVCVRGIDNVGAITVEARYNSSYSLTIDGTYSIDIYTLEWPNNVSPFD